MTRNEAHKIAVELMQKHLEPHWILETAKRGSPRPVLTLRGAQIKGELADELLKTWKEAFHAGYEQGCADTWDTIKFEGM